jgi:hypothetical protein
LAILVTLAVFKSVYKSKEIINPMTDYSCRLLMGAADNGRWRVDKQQLTKGFCYTDLPPSA